MSTTDAKAAAAAARDQLTDTLDAIEDKLNVPKRVGELSRKAQSAYDDNPVPFIVGAASIVAAGIGLVIWAVVRD